MNTNNLLKALPILAGALLTLTLAFTANAQDAASDQPPGQDGVRQGGQDGGPHGALCSFRDREGTTIDGGSDAQPGFAGHTAACGEDSWTDRQSQSFHALDTQPFEKGQSFHAGCKAFHRILD